MDYNECSLQRGAGPVRGTGWGGDLPSNLIDNNKLLRTINNIKKNLYQKEKEKENNAEGFLNFLRRWLICY